LLLNLLTIALISGGDSAERRVSLESGNQVYDALDKNKYRILRYDPKTDIARLISDAPSIDAALIILHGQFGEDGTIQGLLDLLDIPYQGSGVLGSALAMNKLAAKEMFEKKGLRVSPFLATVKGVPFDIDRAVQQLGLPLVVKPAVGGSSIGMSLVKSANALSEAIEKAHYHDRCALVEAFLPGTELTCAVVGNDLLETYPVVEIRPGDDYEFFDFDAKYTPGATIEICPARIPESVSDAVQRAAITAHKALCCRGYSRTDFIWSNDLLYVIETNTIPGMTRTSLLPQSAEAAGVSFSGLLDKLIYLSLEDFKTKCVFKDQQRRERISLALSSL
jgi:D-alanine-D-alanine ligase